MRISHVLWSTVIGRRRTTASAPCVAVSVVVVVLVRGRFKLVVALLDRAVVGVCRWRVVALSKSAVGDKEDEIAVGSPCN